jgi:RNA polymerase sigma factor (sigma-70 family)
MPFPSNVAAPTLDDELAADRALIARLKAGDGEAYEEAVRVYSGRLLAVTRRRTPSCLRELGAPVDVAIEMAHNRALVRECIAELPEQYRVVLMLRAIEDVDTVDVAAMLGISPNAVKIRLHRARQALRTLLAPHFRKEE